MAQTRIKTDAEHPIYGSSISTSKIESKETFIVPLSLFLRVSYTAHIEAFKKIVLAQGKSVDLKQLHLLITSEEHKFKAGSIDEHTFRQNINKLLEINISDESFDQAFNTQLGNLDFFVQNIEGLKASGLNIILMSRLNSIHARAISNISPSIPIHVATQIDTSLRLLYAEVIKKFNLSHKDTTIILGKSTNPDIEDLEIWSESEGIKLGKVEPSRYIVAELLKFRDEKNIISKLRI